MKRRRHNGITFLCLIISVFMVSVLSIFLSAASPTLSTELKPSSDGKTVTVVFTVENNPGIAGFRFTMHYDNKILKPVSSAMNSKITGGMFVSNLAEATEALNVVWVSGTNYTGNGELCSATFSVIGTVKNEQYPITITYDPADLVTIDTSQNPKTADFEVKGITVSVQTASVQSQPNSISSVNTGSQTKNSIASPVFSSVLSASSFASSAKTSVTVEVNSQIYTPDYTGSKSNSALVQQSDQSASGSRSIPSENNQAGASGGTSDTSYPASIQSSANEIPVQSPNGESPDILLITVLSIAAAAVIVLAVLIVKKKKQQ